LACWLSRMCTPKFYFLRADARSSTLAVFLPDVRITQSGVFFALKSFKSILFILFEHIPLTFITQTIRRWNQRTKNNFIKISPTTSDPFPNV
jgi:hypothetical protein